MLMSTYNGHKYLAEQIDSIFKQRGVEVNLYVRDDGSTDNTVEILEKLKGKYEQITIYAGENIGWKKSFIWLLQNVQENADFYAFADQDDVWKESKLEAAVLRLEGDNGFPGVYCSNLTFVDENRNKLNIRWKKRYKTPNELHCIVNGFGMGNTIVFDRKMLELLRKGRLADTGKISHDVLVSVIGVYLARIVFDEESHILYRIHGNNSGTKSRDIIARLSRAFDYSVFFFVDTANYMLNNYDALLSEEQREILILFKNIKRMKNKAKLIMSPYVCRDTLFGSLKVKSYIALYK